MDQRVTASPYAWRPGQRVQRKDNHMFGEIIARDLDGGIKVRWSDGQISYFRYGDEASVHLEPAED